MKITCTAKIPPKLRERTLSITRFTIDTLLSKQQKQKLESVSIRIDKSLANTAGGAIALAYMDIDYDRQQIGDNGTPKNYIIWINPFFTKKNLSKLSRTTFAETIIHELVHVKQSLTGQMKQIQKDGNMVIKFHKKYYKIGDVDKYWLFPWEVEARGYEKGVLNLYCSRYDCFKEFPDPPLK